MSNANIRHRTAGKSGNTNTHHIPRRDSPRNDGDSIRQQKKLHMGVWSRIIAIVGLFTLLVLVISKIGTSDDAAAEIDSSGSVHAGGLKISSAERNPLFVTIVMPSVVNTYARPRRLANIAQTWGPYSRAIYVVHATDEYPEGDQIDEGSKSKSYPQVLLVPGHITVEKGVERLEHVIRTVHKEVDPDFAFFVNDHTFVLPDHLCQFLKEHDSAKDLYAGHALKGKETGSAFNSGAAGYVLSRSTMEKLIKEMDDPKSKCSAANASKWLQGNPGILTAQCFDQVLNIPVLDTRDQRDLSHKFHAYGVIRTVTGKVDDWYLNKHKMLDDIFGVDPKYHHQPQQGAKCCSTLTVSFHYVEADESLAFWEVLQKIHQSPLMSDGEIEELMEKVWPSDKGLGGYAHGLPKPHLAIWDDVINVVRKVSAGVAPPSC